MAALYETGVVGVLEDGFLFIGGWVEVLVALDDEVAFNVK